MLTDKEKEVIKELKKQVRMLATRIKKVEKILSKPKTD
jgi:hypothetical protein